MTNLAVAIQWTCDAYFARDYRRLLRLLLAGSVAFTVIRGYALARDWEQWVVGGWLISYGGGFVRRGLSGELLLRASTYSGVPANLLVYATFVTLFIGFCLLFARLLRRKQITFWYFFLCLSPTFLLFTVYNADAIGRQELLVYVLFVLWANVLARGPVTRPMMVAFGVLSATATLVHELFFLFTPYFVCIAWLASKSRGTRNEWRQALVIPGSALAAVLGILLFSRELNTQALCDRIVRTGAPAKVCDGIIAYGNPAPARLAGDFIGHLDRHAVLGLLLVFPVVLLPVYVFLAANRDAGMAPARLIAIFVLFILFSAPLFVLAVDWGRWISIHTVLLTVIGAHLLKEDERATASASGRPFVGAAAAYLMVGLLIASSTLLWNVKYCCADDLFNPFGPVRAIAHALPLAP